MIFWGIVLLVIGIIVWAIGTAARVHPGVRTAGLAIAAIGVVLLVVGLALMLVNGNSVTVDNPNAAVFLLGLV